MVEELRARDGRVVEIGKRKLAEAEKPVGVAGPFDVERVAEVEGELDVFTLELVDDGAVVDAVDGSLVVVEAVALPPERCDVDGANAVELFGDQKVDRKSVV